MEVKLTAGVVVRIIGKEKRVGQRPSQDQATIACPQFCFKVLLIITPCLYIPSLICWMKYCSLH